MNKFPAPLLEGYAAFKDDKFAKESERYRKLAELGQTPDVLIIACCDSRAAPEIVFNASPGQIFVIRNVANIVPPYTPDKGYHSTSAALEFAIQSLKIRHIVVMGHGRCGGIKAALDPAAEPLSPGDFIGKWMDQLGSVAEEITSRPDLTGTERQTALEQISIGHSLDNLRSFPCVSILEERGRLHLHGVWFDISSGELWIRNSATGDFFPALS
jgi:carbonic anhydrase